MAKEETPAPDPETTVDAPARSATPIEQAGPANAMSGEASERMEVTPDERELQTTELVAGEDYPVGEPQIILEGAWVRLADTEKVRAADPRAVGHIARVSSAYVTRVQSSDLSPRPHEVQAADAEFTVETRDELNLVIPGLTREDFSEVGASGRHEVSAHG